MRRGSLVGPLLIILIGVWFLISSLRPNLPLFDLAARFWPFLLIAWGALRLVEILIWAARGKPLPCRGVTAGEWVAIVFICVIGSGLYAANRFWPWQHFGLIAPNGIEIFSHSYDFAVAGQRTAAPAPVRVLVENLRGGVRITGADTAQVSVSGRKTIRAIEESDANWANQQSPVEISTQGGQVIVRTNQDRVTGGERVKTDLEIAVPRAASVAIHGRHGDLDLSDIGGAVEISSDDADVRLENIGSNARLDLRKSGSVRAANVKGAFEMNGDKGGDVELENIGGEVAVNGSYSGDLQFRNLAKTLRVAMPQTSLRVERLPGQIHMGLGDFTGANLIGPIRLSSSRSRDIRIEQFTQSLDLTLDRGDATLRPIIAPVPKIDAKTRAGDIDLALPVAANFELRAATNHGELNNDFGPALKTEYQNASHTGGSLTGSVGQGPAIVLSTDRGSITIRKDSGAPPAPMAPLPPKGKIELKSGHATLTIEKD